MRRKSTDASFRSPLLLLLGVGEALDWREAEKAWSEASRSGESRTVAREKASRENAVGCCG